MSRDEERLAAEAVALMSGDRPCPTCRGFPGTCCRCRGAIPPAEQVPVADEVEAIRRSGRVEVERGYVTGDGLVREELRHVPDLENVPPAREHLFCAGCLRQYHSDLELLLRDHRRQHDARQHDARRLVGGNPWEYARRRRGPT